MANRSPPRWLIFLGSMELAIALLLMLAIASVIGSFVQQSQPWNDYILKFGPFWFPIYEALGLYHLYDSIWFLCVLGFLVLSVAMCIYRHVPFFYQELKRHKQSFSLERIKQLRHHRIFNQSQPTVEQVTQQLKSLGFRSRTRNLDHGTLIYAQQGHANRLGYLLTHFGVIVICLGALLDSNVSLQWQVFTGKKQPETQNIAIRDIPSSSWLPSDHRSFRGNVDIPEGKAANVAFIPYQDGYFVQRLPFKVKVVDFSIESYPTGQPKSFNSQLEIYTPDNELRSTATINVNHPLTIDGITLYQSNFGDGGSRLQLKSWDLNTASFSTFASTVGTHQPLPPFNFTLEMDDFRLNNLTDPDGKNPVVDHGPSMTFRLRAPDGQAVEYENYQNPILREGQLYFLSGTRRSPTEDFTYLYVPADEQHSLNRFMRFLARLHDTEKHSDWLAPLSEGNPTHQAFLVSLVSLFVRSGLDGIQGYLNSLPDQTRRTQIEPQVLASLRLALQHIFLQSLPTTTPLNSTLSTADQQFLNDSINAIALIPLYPSPVFLQLSEFKHIESSGLQITRSPGQPIVYSGCIMLIIGVFLLFYVKRGRIWVHLSDQQSVCALEGLKGHNETIYVLDQLSKLWDEHSSS